MLLLDVVASAPVPGQVPRVTAPARRLATPPVDTLPTDNLAGVHQDQPPQDQYAEQCVLGAMLLAEPAIADVERLLVADDFYVPKHADVFRAVIELHHAGEPADPVMVGAELQRRGSLARIGGLPYLHTLLAAVPSAANATYYAEIVAGCARQRQAIRDLTAALQRVRVASPVDADDVVATAVEQLGTRRAVTEKRSSWSAVDLEQVLDGTFCPPQPTVGRRDDGVGLFYPGRVHSVSAESEAGKSWFALLAARGELDRGESVLYLDFEDDEGGVVGRLLALGASPDVIRARFAYVRPDEAVHLGRNRAVLADLVERLDPSLAILDGVTEAMTLHGLELIDNSDIARFGAMLPRWLADRGPAVASLDHVTKSSEGRGRYSIGGQHKLAGLNGAAYVLENRQPFGVGVTGRSTVYIAKDRPAQLRQHARPGKEGLHWFADLTLESVLVDGHPVLDAQLHAPERKADDAPFRPTVLMTKVSGALAKAGKPLTKTDVTERVRGRAVEIKAALAALVDEGFVEESGGPNNSRLHTLLKPFDGDQS